MSEGGRTYTVPGQCSNCDYDGPLTFEKGVASSGDVMCPNCGCKTASRRTKPTRVVDALASFARTKPTPWTPIVPTGEGQNWKMADFEFVDRC